MEPAHLDAEHAEVGIGLFDGRLFLPTEERDLDDRDILGVSE